VVAKRLGWIGVDVGTHTVKLAQVVRANGGVRIRHAAVIQRPAPWSDEASMVWNTPSSSYEEISAARIFGGFVGRSAASILPMNVCELHGLTVPQGTEQERRAMISSELAEDWSECPAPMEFDFWELDVAQANERAGGFNVNVLAVAEPWINQLALDCRQSKLDCWSVDGLPLAIARAVGLVTRLRPDQSVLAIDWGFSNVTICFVANRRPLYARKLSDCGLRRLLSAVGDGLAVTEDEAQSLIDNQGVFSTNQKSTDDKDVQTAIAEAAYGTIECLIQQVQRTLQFAHTQRRHLAPSAVWLMGGGATIRNIGPYLAEALEMPVHIWGVPTDATQIPSVEVQRSALFGPAAALSALAWRAA
jgi:type IV pilus assembly protein PilM